MENKTYRVVSYNNKTDKKQTTIITGDNLEDIVLQHLNKHESLTKDDIYKIRQTKPSSTRQKRIMFFVWLNKTRIGSDGEEYNIEVGYVVLHPINVVNT